MNTKTINQLGFAHILLLIPIIILLMVGVSFVIYLNLKDISNPTSQEKLIDEKTNDVSYKYSERDPEKCTQTDYTGCDDEPEFELR